MNDALLEKQLDGITGQKSGKLLDDEKEVLDVYRKAKQMTFADVSITIQEGKRVKLWLTQKMH